MLRTAAWCLFTALVAVLTSGVAVGEDPPAGPAPAPAVSAEPTAGSAQKYSAVELETLVGPIAIYPDVVLSAMLPASAAPLDVVQASRWLESKGGKVDEVPQDMNWDPAVVALLQFPDVLKWMNENLDWVEQMGFAMSVQQEEVLASIQAFRKKAQAAGNLKTDEHMTVEVQAAPPPEEGAPAPTEEPSDVIVIESADPEVVYIPEYIPSAVTTPYYGAAAPPLYGWGLGFAMGVGGAWLAHNIAWGGGYHGGGGSINIDNSWNMSGNRPDGGFGYGPNRPQQWQGNRGQSRPGSGVRPPSTRPGGGAAGVRPPGGGGQGLRPPGRPPSAATRPGAGTRPGGGARPPTSRPPSMGGAGGARPSTRPAAGGALGGAGGNRGNAISSGNRGQGSLGGGRPQARPSTGGGSRPQARPSTGGGSRSQARPRSSGSSYRGSTGGSRGSSRATRGASSRGRSSMGGGGRSGGGRGGGGRGGGGRRR